VSRVAVEEVSFLYSTDGRADDGSWALTSANRRRKCKEKESTHEEEEEEKAKKNF